MIALRERRGADVPVAQRQIEAVGRVSELGHRELYRTGPRAGSGNRRHAPATAAPLLRRARPPSRVDAPRRRTSRSAWPACRRCRGAASSSASARAARGCRTTPVTSRTRGRILPPPRGWLSTPHPAATGYSGYLFQLPRRRARCILAVRVEGRPAPARAASTGSRLAPASPRSSRGCVRSSRAKRGRLRLLQG